MGKREKETETETVLLQTAKNQPNSGLISSATRCRIFGNAAEQATANRSSGRSI